MVLIKLTFTLVKNGESKNNKNIVNIFSIAMDRNQEYYCQNWCNDTFIHSVVIDLSHRVKGR